MRLIFDVLEGLLINTKLSMAFPGWFFIFQPKVDLFKFKNLAQLFIESKINSSPVTVFFTNISLETPERNNSADGSSNIFQSV